MYTFEQLEGDYNTLIADMEIRDNWAARIDNAARLIISSKDVYQSTSVAYATKYNVTIPWQFIGIVHHLESDSDFSTHLHNGDSLAHRTVHDPRGRPINGTPPFTWEESAIDALHQRNIHQFDWIPARFAYEFEAFNGFGYRSNHSGINSPYLWSGTSDYDKGKYVADHVFDPNEVSQQCGAMALLKRVVELDISKKQIVEGSGKLTMLRRYKATATGLFGTYFTADYLNVIPDYVRKFQGLGISKEVWALIGVGVSTWAVLSIVEAMHIGDYKQGRYTPSKEPENLFSENTKL